MRTAIRFLAVLTIAAMLAPGLRWASLGAQAGACACSPAVCRCPDHHHGPGRVPICGMANGGQCGLGSHDSFLVSLLNTLIYVPTEHPMGKPDAPWGFDRVTPAFHPLPSHARIPEQPPRYSF